MSARIPDVMTSFVLNLTSNREIWGWGGPWFSREIALRDKTPRPSGETCDRYEFYPRVMARFASDLSHDFEFLIEMWVDH